MKIDNKNIAHYAKILDFQKKDYIIQKISKEEKCFISEMKTYGKKAYLEYGDGEKMYIIFSKKPDFLYNFLVDLKILDVIISEQIEVKFDFNSNIDIEKITISINNIEYDTEYRDNKIIFDYSKVDLTEQIFTATLNMNIYFKHELLETLTISKFKIPYEEKIIKDDIIFSKGYYNDYLTFFNNSSDKIIYLIDHHIESGNGVCEEIFSNNIVPIKNTFSVPYYVIDKKGRKFISISAKAGFDFEKADKWVNNTFFKVKKSSKLVKVAYHALGYEKALVLKVLKNNLLENTPYRYYAQNLEISKVDNNKVFIESFNSNTFAGNMLAVAIEICKNYPDIELLISAKNVERIEKIINQYGIRAKIVNRFSKQYSKALLEAKYIITDTTLPRYYIKQPGQEYYNTWHGTPLKCMGKKITNAPFDLNNSQRNFLISDRIIVSNEYTKEKMQEDYMTFNIDNELFTTGPSPRNTFLLSNKPVTATKSTSKIVWMPTWRGNGNQNDDIVSNIDLFERMDKIVKNLPKKFEFYGKPHQLVLSHIETENYEMKQVPENIDIYDFLSDADILITDYSSIMFDFAIKNKKVILDIFDAEQYFATRGIYGNFSDLPFTTVENEEELLEAIINNEEVDYSEFNSKYNNFDSSNGTKYLVENIFNGNYKKTENKTKKEKVLLYPGTMLTNGITTSFLNLLSNLDKEKYDYFVFLPNNLVSLDNIVNINKILELDFDYISSPPGIIIKNNERIAYDKFLKKIKLSDKENEIVNRIFARDSKRIFGAYKFNHIVHFTGYDAFIAKLFINMDAKLHIFVHNDMGQEIKIRNNFNEQVIWECYEKSTSINVVNDEVKTKLFDSYFTEDLKKKVSVVHNTINFNKIIEQSNIEEDYLTKEFVDELNNNEIIKFINIARFSPEKGLDRLIESFNNICEKNPNKEMRLYLIGGHGSHTDKIKSLIDLSKHKNKIRLFININPHPILKKSNLFVLSSYYEGLPMVFFESLTLNVPILSTNIPGPSAFLNRGYGNICDNSQSGIESGMQEFLNNKLNTNIKPLDEFNRKAIYEFEEMLKK